MWCIHCILTRWQEDKTLKKFQYSKTHLWDKKRRFSQRLSSVRVRQNSVRYSTLSSRRVAMLAFNVWKRTLLDYQQPWAMLAIYTCIHISIRKKLFHWMHTFKPVSSWLFGTLRVLLCVGRRPISRLRITGEIFGAWKKKSFKEVKLFSLSGCQLAKRVFSLVSFCFYTNINNQ
jgi:hypothetical protein